MPAIPELLTPLAAGPIALRPFAERDIPEILIAYQDDPRMHEDLGEDRPPSGAQLGRASELAEAERQAGRSVALTIVPAGSEVCVGQVRVREVDWAEHRARLDVWVAPQFRGRGFARSALELAAGWLSERCGLTATLGCDREATT